jgi:hypothetical protein
MHQKVINSLKESLEIEVQCICLLVVRFMHDRKVIAMTDAAIYEARTGLWNAAMWSKLLAALPTGPGNSYTVDGRPHLPTKYVLPTTSRSKVCN